MPTKRIRSRHPSRSPHRRTLRPQRWNRPARWLAQTGVLPRLALGLTLSTLLLIGCLQFSETTRWRPVLEKPVAEIARVDRRIRVLLGSRKPRPDTSLEITAPFAVFDAVTGTPLIARHLPLPEIKAAPNAAGGVDLGKERVASNDIILKPERDASIVLNGQTYRGDLRIQRSADGLLFINHVDVEAYLRGVLRGELMSYFHHEAFKAQAVAARTYVLYEKLKAPPDRPYDVHDHEGSQMYIGVRGEERIAVHAVEQTTGEVCVFDDAGTDRIFCTYYSSTCGGLSQHVNNVKKNAPAAPPLCGNVVCTDCSISPSYRWGPVKLSKQEVTKRLVARYPNLARLGLIIGLRPKAITTDGRVISIELLGADGRSATLVGEDFRLSVGGRVLKSTNFEIENAGSEFVFKNGKGFGHGMGLCQYGMQAKAQRGWDYQRILTTYYPGAQIKKLY